MSLKQAIELAFSNPIKQTSKHGAVLVTRSKERYYGINSRKTHPLQKKFGKTSEAICLHAEIDAIRSCLSSGGDPSGATLYVARVTRRGEIVESKPCEGCQRAIIAFSLKDCIWT